MMLASTDSPSHSPKEAPSTPSTSEALPPTDEVTTGQSSSSKKRRKQSNPTRISTKKPKVKDDDDFDGPNLTGDPESDAEEGSSDNHHPLHVIQVPRSEEDEEEEDEEEEEDDEDNLTSLPSSHLHRTLHRGGKPLRHPQLHHRPTDRHYFCPHCSASFSSDDQVKGHIREEHVLKLLERQLLQYQFYKSNTQGLPSNGSSSVHRMDGEGPSSRTSSRSSNGSNPPPPDSPTGKNIRSLSDSFPGMFPFPLPVMAGANDAKSPTGSSGLPINLFPNPMVSPFLFPVLSGQGSGGPGGHPGQMSCPVSSGGGNVPIRSPGGSMGIFNPEAYCDICNKEFCNKYFLKTHKANKHGIYTGDGPPPPPGQMTSSSTPTSSNPSMATPTNSSTSLTIAHSSSPFDRQTSAVNAAAAAATAFFPAGLSPNHLLSQSQSSQDGQTPNSLVASMTARLMGQTVSNPESWCDICQKEFCNKYFLKKHKQKIHGIDMTSGSGNGRDGQSSDGHSMSSSSPPRDSKMGPSSPMSPIGPISFGNGNSDATSGSTPDFSGLGLKEYCSKFFLGKPSNNMKGHQQPKIPDMFDIQSALLSTSGSKVNGSSQSTIGMSSDGQPQIRNSPNGTSTFPSRPNSTGHPMDSRQGPTIPLPPPPPTSNHTTQATPGGISGPKNYCNICNKELCNKYFMKTHMLKMHGINIDEQPAEAQLTSTIGGVTCDICQKELCSKYFLKVHKQNTHGIYEEVTSDKTGGRRGQGTQSGHGPSGNNSTGLSLLGHDSSDSTEMKGPSLAPPVESLKVREVLPREIDGKDTGNRYFSHYTEVCPLCERRFKSVKWLRTHLVNDHADVPLGRIGLGQLGQHMPNLPSGQVDSHDHQINNPNQHHHHPGLSLFPDPEAALNFILQAKQNQNHQQNQNQKSSSLLAGSCSQTTGGGSPPPNQRPSPPTAAIACLKWLKSQMKANEGQQQDMDDGQQPRPQLNKEEDDEHKTTGNSSDDKMEVCPLCDRRFQGVTWLKSHLYSDHRAV